MKIKKKYKIIGLSIILVILIACLSYFVFINFRDKKLNQELQENIPNIEIDTSEEIDVNKEVFKTIIDLQKENLVGLSRKKVKSKKA